MEELSSSSCCAKKDIEGNLCLLAEDNSSGQCFPLCILKVQYIITLLYFERKDQNIYYLIFTFPSTEG